MEKLSVLPLSNSGIVLSSHSTILQKSKTTQQYQETEDWKGTFKQTQDFWTSSTTHVENTFIITSSFAHVLAFSHDLLIWQRVLHPYTR